MMHTFVRWMVVTTLLVHVALDLGSPWALAQSPIPSDAPQASFRWISPRGEVLKATWPFTSEWAWLKLSPTDHFERPVFLTKLRVPPNITIETFNISGGLLTLYQSEKAILVAQEAAKEVDTAGQSAQYLAIHTTAPMTTVRLNLNDQEKKLVGEMTLLIQFEKPKPMLWRHESCVQENVQITSAKDNEPASEPFYTGINCEMKGDQLILTTFWSSDVKLKSSTVANKTQSGALFQNNEIKWESKPLRVGRVELQSATEKKAKAVTYEIDWTPKPPLARFSHSASLGASYLAYEEEPHGIRISQLGLTGKYLASYWLVPKKFDISANAFVTLLPLGAQITAPDGASLSAPRFFGVNGRTGYLLPKPFIGLPNFKISAGWYLWGMLVPKQNYGISMVMGPQVLVSTSGVRSHSGKAWGGYLKFAPMTDAGSTISFSSHELALGGNLELSPSGRGHPLFLTLDLARANIVPAQSLNEFRLLSVSLGVSYGL